MIYQVLKAVHKPLASKVYDQGETPWHRVEFVPVGEVPAATAEIALQRAKRRGFSLPVIGQPVKAED